MTTEQKHTPEPWHYESDDRHDSLTIWATRSGNDDKGIATLCGFGPRSEREANAARIVACVNACAVMKDPAAKIAEYKAIINADGVQLKTLLRERDELLAMLRLVMADESKRTFEEAAVIYDQARIILAKHGGG